MLRSLELTGFKSFPKRSTLQFEAPISAIVGPNGSGKSNIAEAFRFVLGEQSMKSLRGKRGEDLIWNGGGEAGRANRASVKVVFDNSRKFLPIDFPEVTVERVVFRDSENEYLINGSQVRLKDILELLAAAHIGASGHHIISQGEADQILNAPARERREMIEDALGLKIYQYKRLESERKLLKTEENIRSVASLRREIAPHIHFLEKQVEKIEKAKAMREELRSLYKEYLSREEIYLKVSGKRLEEKQSAPKERLTKLERELATAKRTLEASSSKDEKSEKIILLEGNIKEARKEKDQLLRDIGRLEGEITSLERILSRAKTQLVKAGDGEISVREVEAFVSQIEEEARPLEESNDALSLKAFVKKIIVSLRDFISRSRKSELQGDVLETQKDLASLKEKKAALEKQIQEAQEKEKILERQYLALKNEIEKEKDTSREAEKSVFKILAEENKVRGELQALRSEEENLMRERHAFESELDEAKVFVGQVVIEFRDYTPVDENGQKISPDGIVSLPRGEQESRRKQIEKIKIRLEDAGSGGGEEVLSEYKEVTERDAFLSRELADLEKSAGDLKKLIEELGEKLRNEFVEGVGKINKEFQKFFELMFGGGSASLLITKEKKRIRRLAEEEFGEEFSLSAEDEEEKEEIEEGIEVNVSLPRKKIKGLMMLSGGERALTSIALLFAMSQVKPPPFIILDETDAALDEANSRKYGDMVENLSKSSQLILITHNRETMSRAGVLYGVTMDSTGVSKVLSVKFEEAVTVAK